MATSIPERLTLADLGKIVLKAGAHDKRGFKSVCIVEAVAWFAGRDHSDHPPCVSPVVAGFLRSWNDAMNDADRQMLKPLIPRVVNTVGTAGQELQRSYMALDWYCRVSAPAWLRCAGLMAEAGAIEITVPIVDGATAAAAQDALTRGRDAAYKARAAAGDTTWDAAWDAAGAAAWAAARAAAGDTTWDAAGAAAWDAAGAAAWAAAWDAAGAAAWAAARAAAWAAAGAAAWDAAGDKLRPTVKALQTSALELIESMIAVTAAPSPAEQGQ
jgi:hypothetical protein